MRIITLLGSARKKGNTATVIAWVKDQLNTMGHDMDIVHLSTKKIHGCLGCGKCKEEPEKIGCIRNDDAPEIFEKMIQSDGILFASPLYFWGFSAQIKALIDRSYSLVNQYHQPDHNSLIEGRRISLVVTGGGDYNNNAEPVFTGFERISNYYKTRNVGQLYIGPCTSPDKLTTDSKSRAIEFARNMIA